MEGGAEGVRFAKATSLRNYMIGSFPYEGAKRHARRKFFLQQDATRAQVARDTGCGVSTGEHERAHKSSRRKAYTHVCKCGGERLSELHSLNTLRSVQRCG